MINSEEDLRVRVYSRTIPPMLMDEGRVIWYQPDPTIGLKRADGTQASWSEGLLFELLPDTPEGES